MDHTDLIIERILRGSDYRFLAVDKDLPLIGKIDTGDHVH